MRRSGYIIDFVVAGRGDFPMDMLRYDECWPQDTSDASLIARSLYEGVNADGRLGEWVIRLRRFSEHKIGPTVARWESFGWKVTEINE